MKACECKRRPRVILVHGFNVRDNGDATVGRLAPYFEMAGFQVKRFRYGWLRLLWVRMLNNKFATALASMIEPGDVVVGHSNGACLADMAAWKGAPIGQLVYINPALDRDAPLAPQVGFLHVWYSPSDQPVALARFLVKHRWGNMGATGYRGPYSKRVANYNKEFDFPIKSSKHSDVFEPAKLADFGPRIVNKVLQKMP